jgi:anti-sigma factor RsiW
VNCDGFKAGLNGYFHGPCSDEARLEIERHAAQCKACGDLMRLCREISCREFVEFLDQYLANELAPDRRAVFERHLTICTDCTAYVDSYRKTMRLSREALQGSLLPLDVPEDLVRAILAARRRA